MEVTLADLINFVPTAKSVYEGDVMEGAGYSNITPSARPALLRACTMRPGPLATYVLSLLSEKAREGRHDVDGTDRYSRR